MIKKFTPSKEFSSYAHIKSLKEYEVILQVENQIGPIAKPDKLQFVDGLPKTRSGKITWCHSLVANHRVS